MGDFVDLKIPLCHEALLTPYSNPHFLGPLLLVKVDGGDADLFGDTLNTSRRLRPLKHSWAGREE